MAIPFKQWRTMERQAWKELSDEGNLGEIRFNQRVRAKAEAAGYSAEAIQATFKLSAKRVEKAARLGFTAANPMPDDETW